MLIRSSSIRRLLPLLLPALIAGPTSSGQIRDRYHIAGPVEAELVSVIDGDTVMVNAKPWPQQTMTVMVRIRGIDTPELHAHCAKSRLQAKQAREALAGMLETASGRMTLSDISGDKYFGRVVASVSLTPRRDVAQELLSRGLARPYDGGRKSIPACS